VRGQRGYRDKQADPKAGKQNEQQENDKRSDGSGRGEDDEDNDS
jgi:hypothetical protein